MISNNVNLIINHNKPHIWRWFIQPIKIVILLGDGLVEILGEASLKKNMGEIPQQQVLGLTVTLGVFFGDFRIHQISG